MSQKKVVKKTTKTTIEETIITGEKTLIVSVLDRSGSMGIDGFIYEAIGSYNKFLGDQKKLKDEAYMTTILFDDHYEKLFSNVPVPEVEEFTYETWTPRGMTRLRDAIGKTINTVKDDISKMKKKDRPDKVIVVIVTDGGENDSREFESQQVKDMTAECEKEHWTFIYLGADQDAFAEGTGVGVRAGNTLNFSKDSAGMDNVNVTLTNAVSYYRSASVNDVDFAANTSTLMDDYGVGDETKEDNEENQGDNS
jgi:uncharacterized protein YegL